MSPPQCEVLLALWADTEQGPGTPCPRACSCSGGQLLGGGELHHLPGLSTRTECRAGPGGQPGGPGGRGGSAHPSLGERGPL